MTDPAPAKPSPNPYEASVVAPEIVAEVVPYFEPPFVRPRVWTVFVTIAAAFVAMIAVSLVGGLGLAMVLIAGGTSPANLQKPLIELLTAPPAFIGLGLLTQLTLAATAFAAAWLSPQPLACRLGFVRPRWSWWETLVVNVGSLVPFAIGMSGAVALAEVLDPDPTAANLMKSMSYAWALPYLLFISLAPGLSEEMLFRGYAQRRLIERWGGWTAILVTSTIFAVIHLAPHTVVFALPVGIWLGVMAWRSGSIWPGVIAHAAINGLWNAYNIARQFEYLPEEPSWAALGTVGVIGVAAFAWSIVILRRSRPSGATGTANG